MKKVNITISYDEEKLNALKVYLQDKQVTVEDELVKNLDTMYQKMVPASVREYFVKRAGGTVDKPAPKPRKNKQQDASAAKEMVEEHLDG